MQNHLATNTRVLMLIPSVMKRGIETAVDSDRHPRMDYHVLAETLKARGCHVTIIDYLSLNGPEIGFKDARLALLAFLRKSQFDVLFCNSESIAMPLAVMLRNVSAGNRPRVITIGHRITTPKKQVFFTKFKVQHIIEEMFLYAEVQQRFAIETLGIAAEKVPLIAFHADTKFFKPVQDKTISKRDRPQVCSAGLEWRDYPTLLTVASEMQEVDFHIAAASPWSKHRNETAGRDLPCNVTVRRHEYDSLRELYRQSDLTAVPLYETDFQAGVTTILESMACGTTVVTSATKGQSDVITDGQNGFYVKPGDPHALKTRLCDLLSNDKLRHKIAQNGLEWAQKYASLDLWADKIADSICGVAKTVRSAKTG